MDGTGKAARPRPSTGYFATRFDFAENSSSNSTLQHFWVDICCINHLNRAELQKSVHYSTQCTAWYRKIVSARPPLTLSPVNAMNLRRLFESPLTMSGRSIRCLRLDFGTANCRTEYNGLVTIKTLSTTLRLTLNTPQKLAEYHRAYPEEPGPPKHLLEWLKAY